MNERDVLARFNSLLSAGMSLQEAERISAVSALPGKFGIAYSFFRDVCLRSGGSPSHAMQQLQEVLVAQSEADSRVRLASAGPKATTRLVNWLPVAAIVLGQLSGLSSIEVLWRVPTAFFSLTLGVILLMAANLWSSKMLRTLKPDAHDEYFLDACAIGLDVGLPTRLSVQIAEESFLSAHDRKINRELLSELENTVSLSEISGAPIAKLLTSRAHEIRQTANYKKLEEIERLSVRLLWPLGLLVLPAFIFLTVIPTSISLLTKG